MTFDKHHKAALEIHGECILQSVVKLERIDSSEHNTFAGQGPCTTRVRYYCQGAVTVRIALQERRGTKPSAVLATPVALSFPIILSFADYDHIPTIGSVLLSTVLIMTVLLVHLASATLYYVVL